MSSSRSLGVLSATVAGFMGVWVALASGEARATEEGRRLIANVLRERDTIRTIEATGRLSRENGLVMSFRVLIDGDNFRTDTKREAFPTRPEGEGSESRAVIADNEHRRWDYRGGFDLDYADPKLRSQYDLRLLGITPGSTAMLNQSTTRETTAIAMLAGIDSLDVESRLVEDIECLVVSGQRENGAIISAFFDKASVYRGCELTNGNWWAHVWIHEHVKSGGISFPTRLRVRNMMGPNLALDEVTEISDVQINRPIAGSEFTFSGLGAKDGDVVRVRNGSLGDESPVTGVYMHGKILPADADGQPLSGTPVGFGAMILTSRYLLAAICFTAAIAAAVFFERRRRLV